MSRDWQKDSELIKIGETSDIPYCISEFKNMLPYYHQQYAAEKERGDRAIQERKQFNQVYEMLLKKFKESESREKNLREAIEDLLSVFNHEGSWRSIEVSDGFVYALWDSDSEKIKSVENMLDSLYPKEETK